ncbi:MAG: VWA domain-containing protein [Candidatus Lokiarchaeota archaeon]|nr:VWA domain-containing protein [Candidatus Lokiarchaeota archaeon]MBD3201540.1 VWA domain-containing protein [Candidatus Lokiarchaeota archaeon]
MQNLYDEFKIDFWTDLTALTNLAKRISGKRNIRINFSKTQLIYTDGYYIYLPEQFKEDIKTSQGFIAHESGHIGYGSFEISFSQLIKVLSKKYNLPHSLVKKLINVVEDVRINFINREKFPGFYKSLKDYTNQMLPELWRKIKKNGDFPLYLNLFMEDYSGFQKKPKFKTKTISKKDWNTITSSKNLLKQTLTPNSSIIVCDQICKIIKKYYIRKKIIYVNRKDSRNAHNSTKLGKTHKKINNNEEIVYIDENQSYQKHNRDKELNTDNSSEEISDPFYFEEENENDLRLTDDSSSEPFISKYESFDKKHKFEEKSKIEESSKNLIEKIEESEITSKDLEEIVKSVEKEPNEYDLEEKDKISYMENEINEELNEGEFDDSPINIDKQKNQDNLSKKVSNVVKDVIEILEDGIREFEERLIVLDQNEIPDVNSIDKLERNVIETKIEDEEMEPIDLSYTQIISEYRTSINKAKNLFKSLNNCKDFDNFQKRGRLNNKFIKAITTDFKYRKCFTRKIQRKELGIVVLVDISGSMNGIKLEAAKIAMIMLCNALLDIAKLRIVLFTGNLDAKNIILKDFDESIDIRKFDKFGCHKKIKSNLDGVSMKYESERLTNNEIMIIISDGQPAGKSYGLNQAVATISLIRKIFRVFAFSIDARGAYLKKLYGDDWILAHSKDRMELGEKLTSFCRLIVKEFFNQ